MRHILFILISFISIASISQESYTIKGIVLDEQGIPVIDATIYYQNTFENYTDDGVFYVKVNKYDRDTIHISHTQFDNAQLKIKKNWYKRAKNDTLVRYVKMRETMYQSDVVEVGNIKPQTVFGSDSIGVEDFELLENRIIMLGTTRNLRRESILYLTNDSQTILNSLLLPVEAVKLVCDFRKEIHVICKEDIFHVKIENDIISLENIDEDYFYTYLAPVVDSVKYDYYSSNYKDFYPEFKYYKFNKQDSTFQYLKSVEDKLMMELYRSEYKYVDVRTKLWALELEDETGVDKEVWVGAAYFTGSLYYQELYAPMFKKQDSLLLFDHYANHLYKFHPDKGLVDSIEINHHLMPSKFGWKKHIIQDTKEESIYGHYEYAGYTYLKKINTLNGEIEENNKLYYRYVEKICIKDGYAYYIYRPYESMQEKFIYKEAIK